MEDFKLVEDSVVGFEWDETLIRGGKYSFALAHQSVRRS